MTFAEIVSLLEVLVWPAVAIAAILAIRPHLSALLSRSKIKLAMFGQSIETTLPELENVVEEQAGGVLLPAHIEYLELLRSQGVKEYPAGVQGEEQRHLRPLRNSGLISTLPRDAYLADVRTVQLSALGRLYLRARVKKLADA